MTVHTQADPSPHVDQGPDKISDTTRIDRAGLVAVNAAKLPRYASDLAFKASIDGLGTAGADLKTAVGDVTTTASNARAARTTRNKKRRAYDKAYAVAAKLVEQGALTKEDIEATGFLFHDPANPGLVLPTAIDAKYDGRAHLIRLHVRYVGGARACVVEISTDPSNAASWVRLDGTGVKRALAGYAPGTYWIRAATSRAQIQSAWFGPVAIVVK